jgi:glycogen synthase
MVGQLYGSLPVVHDTGGLHDTVEHLDVAADKGNGFVFQIYDSRGLEWAMDKALEFYKRPAGDRERQVARVMREGQARFNHDVCAKAYIDIYEQMLHRPLVRSFE